MRYIVKFMEKQDNLIIYKVTDLTKQEQRHSETKWSIDVWVSEDVRCVSCRGPLVAMSASCAHVKAVKRFRAKL